MTRTTDPIQRARGMIRLEAKGERDMRDHRRHKWVTRLRFGLLSTEGPNAKAAVDYLAAELRALAECPEAIEALAKVRGVELLARIRADRGVELLARIRADQARVVNRLPGGDVE